MSYPMLRSLAASFGAAALVLSVVAMPAQAAGVAVRGDIHETYTYDVPMDWAHRFPPNVIPSDRPYIVSCPVEVVRVGGGNRGRPHTVNITRCY